ncbi:hypothetical protein [Geminisphaera colitermitum]|uniref:hypothetical protein n=1 Tax=Geminisphaera colitermitum TaxID=1148786 RepID=UPI000158C611|nr:hypothetical protein [Geminisphaera colitermitum]
MPNNPTIKGDNTVLWGTGGYYGSAIITTGNRKRSADKAEIRDNNGYVVAVIYYNQNRQASFEMIVQTAAPTLEPGTVITLGADNLKFMVDDVDEKWAQIDVRKYSINATAYDGIPNPT